MADEAVAEGVENFHNLVMRIKNRTASPTQYANAWTALDDSARNAVCERYPEDVEFFLGADPHSAHKAQVARLRDATATVPPEENYISWLLDRSPRTEPWKPRTGNNTFLLSVPDSPNFFGIPASPTVLCTSQRPEQLSTQPQNTGPFRASPIEVHVQLQPAEVHNDGSALLSKGLKGDHINAVTRQHRDTLRDTQPTAGTSSGDFVTITFESSTYGAEDVIEATTLLGASAHSGRRINLTPPPGLSGWFREALRHTGTRGVHVTPRYDEHTEGSYYQDLCGDSRNHYRHYDKPFTTAAFLSTGEKRYWEAMDAQQQETALKEHPHRVMHAPGLSFDERRKQALLHYQSSHPELDDLDKEARASVHEFLAGSGVMYNAPNHPGAPFIATRDLTGASAENTEQLNLVLLPVEHHESSSEMARTNIAAATEYLQNTETVEGVATMVITHPKGRTSEYASEHEIKRILQEPSLRSAHVTLSVANGVSDTEAATVEGDFSRTRYLAHRSRGRFTHSVERHSQTAPETGKQRSAREMPDAGTSQRPSSLRPPKP